jgi:hypothetical protein
MKIDEGTPIRKAFLSSSRFAMIPGILLGANLSTGSIGSAWTGGDST